jgi:hypothetical protein
VVLLGNLDFSTGFVAGTCPGSCSLDLQGCKDASGALLDAAGAILDATGANLVDFCLAKISCFSRKFLEFFLFGFLANPGSVDQ